MKDVMEFYILGLPIDTEIGQCEFLKVKDYPDYYIDLSMLSLTKEHLVSSLRIQNKNGQHNEAISELEKLSLYEAIILFPEIRESYFRVFVKLFKNEDVLEQITIANFSYYRNLILQMNCVKEEKINPNPELQKFIEMSRRAKQNGDKLSFADIVSSVVGFNGLSYQDVNEMTVYQLYMTFHRIAQIKGYDTSTLFATVSSDKIDIQSWCKHIDLFEEEQHGISRDEYKKTTSKVFEN